MLESLSRDIRSAVRAIRAQPATATVAILTLAVGISVNTSIFAIATAVLDPELPYVATDRLVVAYAHNSAAGIRRGNVTGIEVAAWSAPPVFSALGAYELTDFNFATPSDVTSDPERIAGARASAGVFDALGLAPSLGRRFTAAEDRPGGERVALMAHSLWTRRFASSAAAVGSTIVLHGLPYTVIGVLPERFTLGGAEVWVPLAFDGARATSARRTLTVVGRLAPGVSRAQARLNLSTISTRVATRQPDAFGGWTVDVMPIRDWVVGQRRQTLRVLQIAVLVVLLIACSNIANVQLAQAASRRRELAVRSALGASRGRLVRHVLTEALLLSLVGAAAALILALGEMRLARSALPADVPSWVAFRIDGPALGFTLLIATSTALLFGLAPALHGSRTDPGDVLHEEGRSMSGSRRLGRLRSALLAGQLALAMTLFVIAAVLVRFSMALQHADPGFDPTATISARLTLPAESYPSDDALREFHRTVLEHVRSSPHVRAATLTSALPAIDGGRMTSVRAEGGSGPGRDSAAVALSRSVSPEYFDVLGVRFVAGTAFTARDIASGPVVAINEAMARRLFAGRSTVGEFLIVGAGDSSAVHARIVGVVRDTSGIEEGPTAWSIYRPLDQAPPRSVVVVAKARWENGPTVRELRHAVKEIDPLLPLYEVRALSDAVRRQVWAPRALGFLLGLLATLALTLSVVGVYGVAAFTAVQQRREIGIRLALGARARAVVALFVRRSLRVAAIGMVIGAFGGFAGSHVLASRLGVPPSSALLLLAVGSLLTLVTVAASYVPSWRAARVDPLITLRGD